MSGKLLNRTVRVYLLYSLVVMIVAAPLFYFLTDKLFIDDADEALLLRKNEFKTYHTSKLTREDVDKWNNFNRDIKIQPPDPSIVRDSIFYRFYVDTLANENEPYRVLLSPVTLDSAPYTLMVRINLVESEDMITNIATLFCAILGILLTGLYFITRRLSKTLWQPFYSTIEQIEKFEIDKNSPPYFSPDKVEEFNRLNQSINRLVERNIAIFNNQKEFIENAAHELQTPLASFQAKLDTLAQQVSFDDSLSKILSDLNNSVSRLNRINKNLLLLSKIDSNQYGGFERIEVNEVLKKQLAFFAEQADEKNVRMITKIMDPVSVSFNPALFEIAISNLLLNALRHNHKGGEMSLSLYHRTLVISNTGTGGALEPSKLFQRFTQTGQGDGTGLGLAIVKRISDLAGWKLNYTYESQHIFTITF